MSRSFEEFRGEMRRHGGEMRRHDTYPPTASRGGELAFYTLERIDVPNAE
jgi:hypothetical protein